MSSTSLLERTTAGRSWDPKVACAIALTLVFLCGGALGAILMDFRVHNRARTQVFDNPAAKALSFERLQRELDLTPAQSDQVRTVLNDFWDYYRTVMTDSKQRVEQLLTDEQRVKFEKMLQQK